MYHTETINGHSFRLHYLLGGVFDMGDKDYGPIHKVELSPFYIGEYPVTQVLWKAVMGAGNNPSEFIGDHRPVERVSWMDIVEGGQDDGPQATFLQQLNEATETTLSPGYKYRLPTEAEWEYAARGGESYEYAGSDQLKEVSWYRENSHGETKAVGLKPPNGFQLYDMSGNVREWCMDKYSGSFYQECHDKGVIKNPLCEEQTSLARVFRGGSWNFDPRLCRVSSRDGWRPISRNASVGFRLVLAPV